MDHGSLIPGISLLTISIKINQEAQPVLLFLQLSLLYTEKLIR